MFCDYFQLTLQREPKFVTPTGSRGQFDPTNVIVHFVSFKWSFECQPVALTQRKCCYYFCYLLSIAFQW